MSFRGPATAGPRNFIIQHFLENLISKLKVLPTPLVKLGSPFLNKYKISLFVKRIDLIHPHISGNKWYKLFYNLQEANSCEIYRS